ncbi:MAG TPA: chemotaxis protein CheW [Terriglobales bacterium]|nr:chemotaxis protein CheW [Terriglobales bacterium]
MDEISGMDEIIREFLVESREGLDQMDRDLVNLEKQPDSRDLLASIFRSIHTIKGTSGVLGFPKLESVAHVGENLLSRMRDGKFRLNPQITTVLLAMVDALRSMLASIEASGSEGEGDYSEVIQRIAKCSEAAGKQGVVHQSETPSVPVTEEAPIGELLVHAGVTSEAIAEALVQQSEGDPRRIGEILVARGDVKPEAVLEALTKQAGGRPAAMSGSIRVDVGLLDKVMNLVGELVLARNQVLQFTASQQDPAFVNTAQRLNLITTELQEGVMKTRMQPIGNVWNKFPRLVRDLAVACGKRVRIEVEGSETELDKTIIEAIKDPLTHVVRNAVDHGIEAPEARAAMGKPAEGRLSLRAFHEGGQVNIEINDDGAGINVDRVKQKALSRGLVSPEQLLRMTEREVTNLIFLPGFSTAEKVTNVSGRGVGMDVVKTNIEKIGGTVDVSSVAGAGTTLRIKIPLTLAIIPALIVTSGRQRFAIPQISLLELVRLEPGQPVENIQGMPVYRLRGNLLPLVFLSRELSISEQCAARDGAVNIVVLQADGRQFGLVVDEINDTEEIVVKPLGKHLKGLACFAGATIMGDGKVALILDVLGMAQRANVVSDVRDHTQTEEAKRKPTADIAEQQQWLLFTAGKRRRMAVPLSAVARLEEIQSGGVEKAGDREVVQYRGQIMPLIDVSEVTGLGASPRRELLQVIVHTSQGRSVGMVVNEIVDVVQQSIAIEDGLTRPGLMGSAVIQEHVTDLMDVHQVLATANGSVATATPRGTNDAS